MENKDILIAVSLSERVLLMLKENTRETIKKATLNSIKKNLEMILVKVVNHTNDVMITTPIMEMLELIKVVDADTTFVETDNETKEALVWKIKASLSNLYIFAGKFYMTHEFEYSMGVSDLLKRIIDACLAAGFYFGYDEALRKEGEID